jgi:CelD/BcsL family acetyltransferase involved in cellulose biosynthesis
MNYEVMEINDFKKFLELEEEWNFLLSQSQCNIPFLRHEWLMLWWEHFGCTNRFSFIVIRKAGELVFAMPLMETVSYNIGIPFITLESVTNYHSYRYHFLMKGKNREIIETFWKYLCCRPRTWHMLKLSEMPSDIPSYEFLFQRVCLDGYIARLFPMYDSPYLPVQGEWDQYLGSLRSKFRSNMRNRIKRLKQLGNVTYELICDPSDIKGHLTRGFEIEQKSWKGKSGTAIACDSKLLSFYTRWAETAAEKKWLQLSFLKVNGQAVAFDYSLKYQNRLYCMKIGYDPDFYQYSVGQLLCEEVLKKCFEDRIVEYNFLGTMTTQKSDWTNLSIKHFRLFVYNRSWISLLHCMYEFLLKQNLKKWLKS